MHRFLTSVSSCAQIDKCMVRCSARGKQGHLSFLFTNYRFYTVAYKCIWLKGAFCKNIKVPKNIGDSISPKYKPTAVTILSTVSWVVQPLAVALANLSSFSCGTSGNTASLKSTQIATVSQLKSPWAAGFSTAGNQTGNGIYLVCLF